LRPRVTILRPRVTILRPQDSYNFFFAKVGQGGLRRVKCNKTEQNVIRHLSMITLASDTVTDKNDSKHSVYLNFQSQPQVFLIIVALAGEVHYFFSSWSDLQFTGGQ